MKVTEELKELQTLAMFSNLEPAEFEYFHNNYPDFFPASFWVRALKATVEDGVQVAPSRSALLADAIQIQVRLAWKSGFPAEQTIGLIGAGGIVSMGQLTPEQKESRKLLGFDTEFNTYPYQRATMRLYSQPWRARYCSHCGKRFVALEKKTIYCGDDCNRTARRQKQRATWHKHKDEWRPKRKKRGK
jgi:hypothetical protein